LLLLFSIGGAACILLCVVIFYEDKQVVVKYFPWQDKIQTLH